MQVERVFKENSKMVVTDLIKLVLEKNSKEDIDDFFKSLNIKDIDTIIKGDLELC